METKPLQCLNEKEGEEVHIQSTQQTSAANDLVQPKGSESEESQLVKSIEIDSKLSISQSIPNSSQNVTTKAVGPHSAESKAGDSLKLSEENVMLTYSVTIVGKKETMLVTHMPILTMPKYKLKPCNPDMLSITKEALSAGPDFTMSMKNIE